MLHDSEDQTLSIDAGDRALLYDCISVNDVSTPLLFLHCPVVYLSARSRSLCTSVTTNIHRFKMADKLEEGQEVS